MFSYSRFLFLVALAAVLLGACEQSVAPLDIPYAERMVVRGELWQGEPISNINVTRTLPINEEYTPQKAAIDSAVVTVQSSAGSVRLHPMGLGMYGNDALVAQAGETYTLTVEWNGKRVTATTTVPLPVPIDSIAAFSKEYDEWYADTVHEAIFRPVGNQVYALTYGLVYSYYERGDSIVTVHSEDGLYYSERIARRRDTAEDGRIHLRTVYGHYGSGGGLGNDTTNLILYTFDPQFYDFYQTYERSGDFDGPFSTGGETVAWNVYGDGIGMFIGRARSEWRIEP